MLRLISTDDFMTARFSELSQAFIDEVRDGLLALWEADLFLPSACGGSGSCGMCKCKVTKGGGSIMPTELAHLSRKDKLAGKRLSCQLKVKEDLFGSIGDECITWSMPQPFRYFWQMLLSP